MRHLVIVLAASLVACAGEIEPDEVTGDEAATVKEVEVDEEPEPAKSTSANRPAPSKPSKPSKSSKPSAEADETSPDWSTGSSTPLVLSFDDAPVTFRADASGSFDLTRNGMSHGSDWPSAATPWLALDRDGNGAIDDGGELFGSATRLASGAFAKNGFDALRDLDDNHDGVFDANDAAFAKVVVWTDRNADRVSTPNELTTLAEAGVRSIDLHDRREVRCDARMNCEGERSRFTRTDGRGGAVIDVYLPTR
ncbi:MAG: calcium-binding protein [Labilithrix sp.]|nr:calcium-binding protein [Labilithrix sp.]MCW5813600.1 calcium-binding protein [Labilithrix sp.]